MCGCITLSEGQAVAWQGVKFSKPKDRDGRKSYNSLTIINPNYCFSIFPVHI